MPNNCRLFASGKDWKPMAGKRKGRVVNISPSQKLIRVHLGLYDSIPVFSQSLTGLKIGFISDFKKSEVNKFGSSPNCIDMTKLSTEDWQVLYTTQITQKAKKFHDGFLQLIIRGSQGRQVKLYDTNRRHLDGRFLKKDEKICSGESLVLDSYLVEIGEQEEDQNPPADSKVLGTSCGVAGKSNVVDYLTKTPSITEFDAGIDLISMLYPCFWVKVYCANFRHCSEDFLVIHCSPLSLKSAGGNAPGALTKLSDPSYKSENAKLSGGGVEPKRSVYDIMSSLRQPSERKVVSVNKPFTEENYVKFSRVSVCTNNHVQEQKCSGTERQELRQKGSEHDGMIKVIKSEAVEVIKTEEYAIPEDGRVPQARSSSFHLRPRTVNFISPIHDVHSSSMESHAEVAVTVTADIQKEVESDSLTRKYNNQEMQIRFPCEEVVTGSNAALENGSSSSKSPELQEDKKGSSSRCNNDLKETSLQTKDMDEIPSFDLGF
ncbi:hypothetical protein SASPL_130576 [Salvia splendens]|uniref:5'-3' DNA helicase ZGRF1-like N-terminal domain-containing protein n=1 Tax=Salvia splendens TaxID=180675 RepID=A0A8X8X7H9_SALSN|nr:hypothetical protein SASPL_130576 [Salvia splendens]